MFFLVSVCCDTAQALVFLLVSVCQCVVTLPKSWCSCLCQCCWCQGVVTLPKPWCSCLGQCCWCQWVVTQPKPWCSSWCQCAVTLPKPRLTCKIILILKDSFSMFFSRCSIWSAVPEEGAKTPQHQQELCGRLPRSGWQPRVTGPCWQARANWVCCHCQQVWQKVQGVSQD